MLVKFYQNSSDNNVLNKVLTFITELNITLTGDNIKENPNLILDYNATLINCNYCYIPEFNRYYYISPHYLKTGHRLLIECKTDLLMSAKADILNSYCTITRSNRRNSNITDPLYIKGTTATRITRKLGVSLETSNTGTYIVQIGG